MARDDASLSCVPRGGGRPRLVSEQCQTCIFRPGNVMELRPGRLKGMIRGATGEGTEGIICHSTLPDGPHPEVAPALCRGFYDLYGHLNNFVRIMLRLGGFDEVEIPAEEEEPGCDGMCVTADDVGVPGYGPNAVVYPHPGCPLHAPDEVCQCGNPDRCLSPTHGQIGMSEALSIRHRQDYRGNS